MRSRFKNGKSFLGSVCASLVSFFSEFVFNQDILLPSYRSPGLSGRSFLFWGVPTLPRKSSGNFEEVRDLLNEKLNRFKSMSSYICGETIELLRKGFERFPRTNFHRANRITYYGEPNPKRSLECGSSYTVRTLKFSFTKGILSIKGNSTDFSPPSRLHHPTRVGRFFYTEDRRLYDGGKIHKNQELILGSYFLVRDIILLFSHRYLTFPQILDTKR